MEENLTRHHNKHLYKQILFLLITFLTILTVFYIDLDVLDTSLLAKGPPKFSFMYILRTTLIASSSFLFIIFVANFRSSNITRNPQNALSEIWDDWGLVVWKKDASMGKEILSIRVKKLIVLAIYVLSLFFLYIFLTHPRFFNLLCLEDRPIEASSAILYFINCGIFVYIFFALRRNLSQKRMYYLFISLSLALLFFVIGMEEISWCQRIFSIRTPELFHQNSQNEINLHNFASNIISIAYYFFAFVGLILIPFLYSTSPFSQKDSTFSFFVPSRYILIVSAVFVAYNYNRWNIVFTQLCFFITLFILIYYTWLSIELSSDVVFMLTIVTVYILMQVVFLIFGDRFVRNQDITEYKEFFIPLSCLIYSIEILQKVQRIRKNYFRERTEIKVD